MSQCGRGFSKLLFVNDIYKQRALSWKLGHWPAPCVIDGVRNLRTDPIGLEYLFSHFKQTLVCERFDERVSVQLSMSTLGSSLAASKPLCNRDQLRRATGTPGILRP